MRSRKTSLTSRSLAKKIAGFASDKKALDIVILDMRQQVNFCDYFVLCSGNTDRQVRAIADAVEDGLAALNVRIGLREGEKEGTWVVFDTGDVVVHVFQKNARQFYNLEYLWQDAKPVKWEEAA